jgi:uncharacterized membrane protein
MMSHYDYDTYDYYEDQVQPAIDQINQAFTRSWVQFRTAVFTLLYLVLRILSGIIQIPMVIITIIFSITSLLLAIVSGLKLLIKVALDWVEARPELQAVR